MGDVVDFWIYGRRCHLFYLHPNLETLYGFSRSDLLEHFYDLGFDLSDICLNLLKWS